MSYNISYETGTFELFSDTIRAWVSRNWTASNTANKTPTFISPGGKASSTASTSRVKNHVWPSNATNDEVYFNEGDTLLTDDIDLGRKIYMKTTIVYVDIFSRDARRQRLYEIEINRIIANNFPDASTRINKSNNSNVSAISTFQDEEIEFIHPESIEGKEFARTVQSSGELLCNWQVTR